MNIDVGDADHQSWRTVGATFVGYLALLVVMTVLLFGIPTLLFFAL